VKLGRYTIQASDSKIASLRQAGGGTWGNRLCAGGAIGRDQEKLAGVYPVHVLDLGVGRCKAVPSLAGAELRGCAA
jgi:hypothetical protein